MGIRLSASTLNSISTASRPAYDRQKITTGLLHLGIGGFHRAHQAVYTDKLLADGHQDWGITGVSLRSSSVRDLLTPQDFLYSVNTLGEDALPPQIIGSVLNTLAIRDSKQLTATLDLFAHPATQVVSLTVTEKGYCATLNGDLDLGHPDIVQDLANPREPVSAPGLLAVGLERRMLAGAGPISILSCDNLAGNGRVTERVVKTMAALLNPELATWIDDNLSFPSTMVDRIVPQTSARDIDAFELTSGYRDAALISGEGFSQWVIEDNFRGKRPAWDIAGAQFVNQVAPFEQAKLRLLNATHSALAYLGLLADHTYVHEALADPAIGDFVRRLLNDEISPEVDCPEGMDITDYKASLLKRFANVAVPYKTLQVASDGSQKLPQRIFPTLSARLNKQQPSPLLCAVVAAWIQCLAGKSDSGAPISVSDPAASEIAALAAKHLNASELIQAIAQQSTLFGALANSSEFLQQLGDALANLRRKGALATIGRR